MARHRLEISNNELKDDYLEETHDEQMVKELNRLNNLSKQNILI